MLVQPAGPTFRLNRKGNHLNVESQWGVRGQRCDVSGETLTSCRLHESSLPVALRTDDVLVHTYPTTNLPDDLPATYLMTYLPPT
ncbi:hypothetical protein F7725_022163 [Dissostichus mawsoni]|uniref:Uncharacterized protein n=1 Tax=Dissostichus mawsoni TaxID=36200 RepID=A0A7J5ZD61_DISMA|nr:hypothetical protein F7725_022163 [Dissostichus mawsoni]